jgi:pyruvate/2-oxoglutarate dehydrogenase complex dihydrolipoamide dehydrogenase (E3) component
MADNAKQLSDEVTILTHGSEEVAAQVKAMAAKSPFKVDSREISKLEHVDDGVKICFKDGSSKCVKFIVHNPLTLPQGGFVQQLGLELLPTGDIKADAPMYQTSSRGVFAAGDCITSFKVVPHAIASGNFAAVAVATQLQAEKYEHVSLV